MDASFILIIAASAIIMSVMMIYAEITRRRRSVFRLTFGVSYLFAIALMQPWRVASAQEAGMSVMMLVFMAIWVAIGCFIGGALTATVIAAFSWIKNAVITQP
ncbi:hypothetical protein J2Y54_001523 [Sphingomonas sp. BE123]|uniref:hypothetical protein n=1 Tax=Sphingomonas sp. BE123 TaxID=2817842 RepID=UPI002860A4F0|nr:hypothetical protein [Sphingomonas sp. BE123]MDR6852030.1 hypothetical protein [Sphingomonas sp. BE123]